MGNHPRIKFIITLTALFILGVLVYMIPVFSEWFQASILVPIRNIF